MALNKLTQKQVVGDSAYEFDYLEDQMLAVESRTRVPAVLRYNSYIQWNGGALKTNVDYTTLLDKITITEGQSSATFVSYAIDTGALGNVKFTTFDIAEVKDGGSTTEYFSKSADTEEGLATATWIAKGTDDKIDSLNGRFIQFKVVLTKGTVSPVITSVGLKLIGAAATQEVYDARGGYKTLAIRLENMFKIARVDYTATNDQTNFLLPDSLAATGSGVSTLVYVNGQLQTYGLSKGYLFNNDGTEVVFNDTLEGPSGAGGADIVTILVNETGGKLNENKVTREEPVGNVNGDNTVFTIEHDPILDSEELFLSGILLEKGTGPLEDYTMVGRDITMNYAPLAGEKPVVSYRYWSY